MSAFTDADLYRRGADTLVASWQEYARETTDAAVLRLSGVTIALFANEPERSWYNNALLEGDLTAGERAEALDATEAAYAGAGITSFAAWVHERDTAMRADLEQRGYTVTESTRVMGWRWPTFVRLGRRSILPGPTGLTTCVSSKSHRTCSAAATTTPSTS
jgi:hypothetical protein